MSTVHNKSDMIRKFNFFLPQIELKMMVIMQEIGTAKTNTSHAFDTRNSVETLMIT